MHVPLVIGDFLERSDLRGPDGARRRARGRRGPRPGELRRAGRPRRAGWAAGSTRAGIGPGERVTIVTPNAARMTIAYFGVCAHGRVLGAGQLPPSPREVAEIVAPLGRLGSCRGPGPRRGPGRGAGAPRRVALGRRRRRRGPSPRARPRRRRGRPYEDALRPAQLHLGGPPRGSKGVHADPPLGLDPRRRSSALADGHHRARRLPAEACPKFDANGWGLPFAPGRHRRPAGGAAPDRRRRRSCAASRRQGRHRPLRGSPARGGRDARRAARRGVPPARRCPGAARVRMMVGGAPPSTRMISRVRGRARLGVRARLGPHRVLAGPDAQPHWGRRPTTWGPRSARACSPGPAFPVLGTRIRVDDDGEALARSTTPSPPTAAAPGDGRRRSTTGGRAPATPAIWTTTAALMLTDRRKDVILTGAENVTSMEVENAPPPPTRRWPTWPSSASPTSAGARRSRAWWCCARGSRPTRPS